VSLDLDGELSQLERAMAAAHLRHCSGCRSFRDDLIFFTGAIREAPLEELERPLVLRHRRRVHVGAVRVAAVAASLVVAVGLGLSVGQAVTDASRAKQVVRPAYLDSPGYDLRIIEHALDARQTRSLTRAV
jgi:predicted anti-sigma-YlaC factor YlaD